MHKALAVMYRPIVAGKGEFYEIEPYEGSDKYSDVMKDAPVTVALIVYMPFLFYLFLIRFSLSQILATLNIGVRQAL